MNSDTIGARPRRRFDRAAVVIVTGVTVVGVWFGWAGPSESPVSPSPPPTSGPAAAVPGR